MATKAYFVVSVDEEFYQNRYQDVLTDLETISETLSWVCRVEVESIERVRGTCDLLVKVDTPIKAVFVANKVLAKEWTKRLYMLKVEPFRTDEYQGLSVDDLLRLKRVAPAETAQKLSSQPVYHNLKQALKSKESKRG